MKKILFIVLLGLAASLHAQSVLYPSGGYKELSDPATIDTEKWDKQSDGIHFAWGSTDVRYAKSNIPATFSNKKVQVLSGWKGEKVNAQMVLWSKQEQREITLRCSDLRDKQGNVIRASSITTGFVRYVMTDELDKSGKSGCGKRPDKTKFDSLLVADPIDPVSVFSLSPRTLCPIWLNVKIPHTAVSNIYEGEVAIYSGKQEVGRVGLKLKVGKRTLPAPSQWQFHLDLWQNPFAVARYYQTGLWTKEHFEAMRPVMKALADAGQKVITASIMHKPWNGQTYDAFESMVTWTRKVDGSWHFDFDVFDKWVEFMMDTGIDKQINCYSMVPWAFSFQYFDQATNRMQIIKTKLGEQAYNEIWLTLLKSFAKHLKEKGWFEKTVIAMDERPLQDMIKVESLIKKADPDFKLSLAGLYYEEIDKDIYDYCLSTDQVFPMEALKRRKAEGKISTYYTYCADTKPNTFTFSEPAEAAWIGIYAAALNLNGYLRWAYNSWTESPLTDSRFISWAAGDTYLVYPGFRSSIRFERLIEGIQDYEKIRILREYYDQKKDSHKLMQIDKMLSEFNLKNLSKDSIVESVKSMRKLLNSL